VVEHTQREKILSLLVAARGGEVSAVELSKISLQYGARLKELRQMGLRIINRVEVSGRTRHGFFRLVTGTTPTPQLQSAYVGLFPREARHFDDN
jgi:hypothetical protein